MVIVIIIILLISLLLLLPLYIIRSPVLPAAKADFDTIDFIKHTYLCRWYLTLPYLTSYLIEDEAGRAEALCVFAALANADDDSFATVASGAVLIDLLTDTDILSTHTYTTKGQGLVLFLNINTVLRYPPPTPTPAPTLALLDGPKSYGEVWSVGTTGIYFMHVGEK